jgi:hypothetical protein
MAGLDAVWNPALGAWVIEPGLSMHRAYDLVTGTSRNIMDPEERRRIEISLRGLRVPCELEWQVDGPSALPHIQVDTEPVTRTSRRCPAHFHPGDRCFDDGDPNSRA